ncbi:hypothetical protein CA3LBN_000867 [Candidozyma haemuli]|uniref:Tubulin gamma chain n=1 Tax=Candidozyma haemuli TaxID=45357 RepID=A0ABX8I2I6_9ASCO|nr:hypothetical protein CA3LBN_000867 [[Candida] haemuloni]
MPGEIITIQAGQCGNQVGLEYWRQLALDHGIAPDGTPQPYVSDDVAFESDNAEFSKKPQTQRPDVMDSFFTLSEQNKFTPRSILIDLEPSVVNKATSKLPMFNPRNIHLSETGSGAANNWQHGYVYGRNHEEEMMNLIDRELDKCDNPSAFQLMHSVAGGTGSGVGSLLLELLNDRYGSKKIVSTFSVFPSNDKTSDVVVQPYNTMLTLRRLIDFGDATFVFDNDSLNALGNAFIGSGLERNLSSSTAFESANKLIAYVAAGITNPLRFPSYMYSSYESIISTVVPTPELKFLSTSIAPYSNIPNVVPNQNYVSLNEYDIILELLNDKYKLNSYKEPLKYISVLDYVIGKNLNQKEIRRGILKAQQRLSFVPWTPSSISVVNGKQSAFTSQQEKRLSGIQVSNNTSIVHLLSKTVKQYDLLAKRAAYINFYTTSNDASERQEVLDAFEECKETVRQTIDEYKACSSDSYLGDDIIDEEMT